MCNWGTNTKLPEEEIKKIKHWFTSDILVSIHKTNSYNKIYDEVNDTTYMTNGNVQMIMFLSFLIFAFIPLANH